MRDETIEAAYPVVKITLDFNGIKILCPTYDEEEEDNE
jgi:hypothetical protein